MSHVGTVGLLVLCMGCGNEGDADSDGTAVALPSQSTGATDTSASTVNAPPGPSGPPVEPQGEPSAPASAPVQTDSLETPISSGDATVDPTGETTPTAGGPSSASGGAGGSGTTANGSGGGGSASVGTGGSAGASMGGVPSSPATSGESDPSPGCGSEPPPSGRTTIDVAGSTREYILKVPDDYDATEAHKLIFAFHARGGNATQVAGGGNDDYYGLNALAGGSAILVSPEGLDAGWRNTDGRDIAFVRAMIEEFGSSLCIDRRRIFSTGFSFGGMMSDAIGCAMADVFRAIAPMAGGIPNDEHPYSGCDQLNQHPIAVWMAHGDNDTVVPLSDGMDALNIFLERSGCQTETMPVEPSPCVAYQGCDPDYPIQLCQFSGGHQVPNFAANAIWNFFDQF